MSDNMIVNLMMEKDENGIAELVKLYGKVIYGVIYKTLACNIEESEADFIFNDILFRLWNNIGYYDHTQAKLINYIISVAKFATVDYIRKNNKKIKELCIEEKLIGNEDDDILSEKEKFLDVITPLNEVEKDIFIRRFYLRESVNDIAKSMGVSPGSISNKIMRGKQKLKQYI